MDFNKIRHSMYSGQTNGGRLGMNKQNTIYKSNFIQTSNHIICSCLGIVFHLNFTDITDE